LCSPVASLDGKKGIRSLSELSEISCPVAGSLSIVEEGHGTKDGHP